MTEGEGFEPPVHLSAHNGFQDRRIQPLCHPSGGGMNRRRTGQTPYMAADDDDDWVGEPPEGRHSRARADPEFWRNQRPYLYASALLGFMFLVVLLVALLA